MSGCDLDNKGAALRATCSRRYAMEPVSAVSTKGFDQAQGGPLKVLSLFAGIGGFDLGLERTGGFRTVAFCEIDPARQADLRSQWPDIPIYSDVRDLRAEDVAPIDVITAGFPCQDLSIAGAQAGLHGERSGLFAQAIRLIGELRPKYAILENSTALLTGSNGDWASHLFGELATLRYDAEWHVIPASGLGAPHDRERVWIIASDTCAEFQAHRSQPFLGRRGTSTGEAAAVVADDYRVRELQSGWRFTDQRGRIVHDPEQAWSETWIEKLSHLRGVDDGLPRGLSSAASHRFGNAVVPQIPELIGRAILAAQAERLAA